jgi:predicted permease
MIAIAALSNHGAWEIALVIGLVVALAVAGLLVLLVRAVGDIKRSVSSLLDVAGKVAGNTANIPQLEATAPVLGLIVEEAVVQDGYMNALTDGYGSGNGAR